MFDHGTKDGDPSRRSVIGFALTGVALAAGLAAPPSVAAPPQAVAATVTRIQGTASATWSGLTRTLVAGAIIFVGDEVRTSTATRLEIRMNAGTVLTLGENTTMIVEGEESAAAASVVSILEGVFLGATRAIADLSRDSLTIRTTTAVLGVRGTVVWGEQRPAKLAACMLEGTAVAVTTAEFSTVLTTPLDGTDVVPGQPPTPPKRWGDARLAAARAAVAFD